MPDFLEQGCPVDAEVTDDAFWYLTGKTQNRRADYAAAA